MPKIMVKDPDSYDLIGYVDVSPPTWTAITDASRFGPFLFYAYMPVTVGDLVRDAPGGNTVAVDITVPIVIVERVIKGDTFVVRDERHRKMFSRPGSRWAA